MEISNHLRVIRVGWIGNINGRIKDWDIVSATVMEALNETFT